MRKRKNFAENNAFVMHANVRGGDRDTDIDAVSKE